MKVLYGASMARLDLLRAICHRPCFVTERTLECERKLHRLIWYIRLTYSLPTGLMGGR